MDWLTSLLLGVLQGVAEWLPVSSEGWIYVISTLLLKIDPREALTSALFLHLGTSTAAILVLRREIREALLEILRRKDNGLGTFLAFTTAFTCFTGFPLYLLLRKVLQPSLGRALALATGFLLLGVGLFIKAASSHRTRETSLSLGSSALAGFLQGLSVLPGVSRSGITLAALMFLGFGRSSLKICFLLGIPVTLGASLLQIPSLDISMLPAFVSSFLTSIISLRTLLSLSNRIEPWKLSFSFGLMAILLSVPLFL
ncbi:MAG TPA: hypothetical protein ENF57_00690 [Candidatus Korarchaeota archaeon]|nr:MAG: hypothetical protein DRO05_02595 [Candidatus Korarchaeota archaeon]HDI73509.1 hypothetical protein [Candidatus Korarchaeota archaeon]